jgi:type I restriction enzyme S subunit
MYPELGIRSFGNGTFHKPALSGLELGSKRIFTIEVGDLLFNNVFAWEGAIAVAKPEDTGRFGSHRFITCVPNKDKATSRFLCFYFLTSEGLDLIRDASPGGAGRNRTLGLEALANISIPVPDIEAQFWFDKLHDHVGVMRKLQGEAAIERDALLPSSLAKAFNGEF